MQQLDLKTIVLLAQGLICISLLIVLYRAKREKVNLITQLTQNSAKLKKTEQERNELIHQLSHVKSFQENLKEAKHNTQLQQTQRSDTGTKPSADTPERYRYIKSLHLKGMDPNEIATILNISVQEIEQLLALSKIAHKN